MLGIKKIPACLGTPNWTTLLRRYATVCFMTTAARYQKSRVLNQHCCHNYGHSQGNLYFGPLLLLVLAAAAYNTPSKRPFDNFRQPFKFYDAVVVLTLSMFCPIYIILPNTCCNSLCTPQLSLQFPCSFHLILLSSGNVPQTSA